MSNRMEPLILSSDQSQSPTVLGGRGNFRVIRLLGRGTMSSVYLAEQVSMARPVALKILSPSLSSAPAFVESFLREARASARLNHPNIVSAIDFGEFESRFFLVMEFVDGVALSTLLAREGALEENRVIGIGLQVISALEHAASHHVIHLDVKPANIMVGKDGNVKLADFGLAKVLEKSGVAHADGKAVGTPYYMAPEQVEGGELDWRSDQFSLGASLYEAVTGVKPFQGNSVSDILVKRFFEKPTPAWRTGRRKTSRGFSATLAKMLSRSPEGRYQTFGDLEGDFIQIKAGKKPLSYRNYSSTSTVIPSAASWDSFGYFSVIRRVEDMVLLKRWRWLPYFFLMFAAVLAAYGLWHSRELAGPAQPHYADLTALAEIESPPDGKGALARDRWLSALGLTMQAEREPTPDNIRRAMSSLRLLAEDPDFKDTAYANAARGRLEYLTTKLEEQTDKADDRQ